MIAYGSQILPPANQLWVDDRQTQAASSALAAAQSSRLSSNKMTRRQHYKPTSSFATSYYFPYLPNLQQANIIYGTAVRASNVLVIRNQTHTLFINLLTNPNRCRRQLGTPSADVSVGGGHSWFQSPSSLQGAHEHLSCIVNALVMSS